MQQDYPSLGHNPQPYAVTNNSFAVNTTGVIHYSMKSFIKIALCSLLFLSFSCKEEDNVSPGKGNATFSLSQKDRINGRTKGTTAPAFIVVSIQDSNGSKREEVKLNLFTFGSSYLSEHLELPIGSYQLTHFVVFDASNSAIYATPLEGSELAKFVTDSFPIEFTVTNDGIQVNAQVLAVLADDKPALFGYVSFGFGVVARVTNLNIQLHYPDSASYDSAYIVFKNSETQVKQKLILNSSTYTASAVVTTIPSGNWNISTSYFSTIKASYESLEKSNAVSLDITPTTTDLLSNERDVFIKDGNDPIKKSIHWVEYYYYQLYLNSADKNTIEGYVRLPKDPTNPFIEITTFKSKWIYAYADRSFYNSSLDGTSNHYQGGGAFEIYGTYGETHDRLDGSIIDTTSLEPGILGVRNRVWNLVDGVVIIEGITNDQELLIYHEWDLRTSGGRVKSRSGAASLTREEIEKRRIIHLPKPHQRSKQNHFLSYRSLSQAPRNEFKQQYFYLNSTSIVDPR